MQHNIVGYFSRILQFFYEKVLTNPKSYAIISFVDRHTRPLGQVVKTPPFHGDNMGSNPVGVITKNTLRVLRRVFFLLCSSAERE